MIALGLIPDPQEGKHWTFAGVTWWCQQVQERHCAPYEQWMAGSPSGAPSLLDGCSVAPYESHGGRWWVAKVGGRESFGRSAADAILVGVEREKMRQMEAVQDQFDEVLRRMGRASR